MNERVPQRYRLTVREGRSFQELHRAMWAFSAADVIVQYELSQKDSLKHFNHQQTLEQVEPWREEVHGPWPEHLR